MQSNNAEDENKGQDKDNNRVNLQSGRFVRVESYKWCFCVSDMYNFQPELCI